MYICRFLFLLIFFIYPVSPLHAQVVINEIQASNAEVIFDEDGDAEDWIELFNNSNEPVNLNGFGLSDDYDNPFRWIIPDITIEPGEFLLIWASGKDRTTVSAPLHTNFRIDRDGEEVLLTTTDSTRIDEIPPTPIPRDVSYGRYPDGGEDFYFFDEPTPGSPNTSPRYEVSLQPPVFSHKGGSYRDSFQLTFTADEDADIYYTLDGSLPERETARRYTGPVFMSGSRTIRARAFKEGALPSEPKTYIFNRLSPDLNNFDSNLPLVIINEYDTEITAGDRTPASITIFDRKEDGRSDLWNEEHYQSRMIINKRGSSSLAVYPKHMFGFHLRDELDENRNSSLLGLPPEHNWILYAPYGDFTLMRNAVAYTLFGDMGWYSPRVKFVELFLHNGNGPVSYQHYYGVYVLVERIKWDNNRVNITKITPQDNNEPEITGGYIIKKDRLNEGERGMRTNRGTLLAHVRPNEEDITRQQRDWLLNYMNEFESTLYGSNFDDPENGYEKYIDVDSFIDHFLHTELLKEIDGYRLSTFMHKDREGKLKMGPVWDYNFSLGIADYLEGWIPEGWYYEQASNDCFVGCGVRDWYLRLMEDPNYMQRMQERWWELRQGIFSREYLMEKIGGYKDLLDEAQQREFQRWPRIGTYVWPNWYLGFTYSDEVNWMMGWLSNRISWMDRQMGDPPDTLLKYFWYFSHEIPNNTPLETLNATYLSDEKNAYIQYHSSLSGYPFNENHENWRQASMERRNMPTNLNYRTVGNNGKAYDEDEMRGLQVRQPFRGDAGENTLIFHIPTTDSEEIVFSFTAKDEGAADQLIVDYSVSPDEPAWNSSGIENPIFELSEDYGLYTIDFTDITEVNDNPDFKIRIRFDGEEINFNEGNRVTFNNISVEMANPDRRDREGIIGEPGPHRLEQNYPNPFNNQTTIAYRIPVGVHVKLEVYDLMGRLITVLVNESKEAGVHEVMFDAASLASGLYLYRLTTPFESTTKKMLLVK